MYEVSSEIYAETDFQQIRNEDGKIISKFKFHYPNYKQDDSKVIIDEDGDFIVPRQKYNVIEIEHLDSTTLQLVGLQVWRGALLLADFIFHYRDEFCNRKILELGAGVGLTSIAAGIYSKQTILCSDIDVGGILELIHKNVQRNRKLLNCEVNIIEIDFKNFDLCKNNLKEKLDNIEIVIAADVIYDDDLTDSFIEVLNKLLTFNFQKKKTIYMALEQRYVFTIADLETVAPCYHYFRTKIVNKNWKVAEVPIDFPQYFEYERCKELILLKIYI